MSLAGFVAALKAGLEIHADYPNNRAELAGKQPQAEPQFATPEQSPRLAKKYGAKLDYEGKVGASCIHCHQVGEALQSAFRDDGKPIPFKLQFPYPHPKILGLIMDPNHSAKVARVETGSAAAADGFLAGDEIVTLGGQSILSTADLQWVLHNVGDERSIPATIRRDGQTIEAKLTFAPGWRDARRYFVAGNVVVASPHDNGRDAAGGVDACPSRRTKAPGGFAGFGGHARR